PGNIGGGGDAYWWPTKGGRMNASLGAEWTGGGGEWTGGGGEWTGGGGEWTGGGGEWTGGGGEWTGGGGEWTGGGGEWTGGDVLDGVEEPPPAHLSLLQSTGRLITTAHSWADRWS
ncbi:hypothetical protein N665_0268s0061, partial [Sinapis alba]